MQIHDAFRNRTLDLDDSDLPEQEKAELVLFHQQQAIREQEAERRHWAKVRNGKCPGKA